MAKEGTLDHPKTLMLAGELGKDPCDVLGILEAMWAFARKYTPEGDIGKFSDASIALGIRTSIKPDRLVTALVKCGWLDISNACRLVVHDWKDHATKQTEKVVRARGKGFASGHDPRRNTSGRPPASGPDEGEEPPPSTTASVDPPPPSAGAGGANAVTANTAIADSGGTAKEEISSGLGTAKQAAELQALSVNAFSLRALPNLTKPNLTTPNLSLPPISEATIMNLVSPLSGSNSVSPSASLSGAPPPASVGNLALDLFLAGFRDEGDIGPGEVRRLGSEPELENEIDAARRLKALRHRAKIKTLPIGEMARARIESLTSQAPAGTVLALGRADSDAGSER